jgi:hypothetical protein
MNSRVYIGIVEKGMFGLLFPASESTLFFRLTTTGLQDSVPPEAGELNLVEYEQTAIAVEGHIDRNWIYSAIVVDTGEPIVTALVEKIFGQ